MAFNRLRAILGLTTVVAVSSICLVATAALFRSDTERTEGTFACGTLVITSVTPQGKVFSTDLRVGNLTPGDEGWGKILIKNIGTLDAWVSFTDYTIDSRLNSVFRDGTGNIAGPRLTLSHSPALKLIPAGAVREYSINYHYPLNVSNGHQGRTGAATLHFTGTQVNDNPQQGWPKSPAGTSMVTFTALTYEYAHDGVVKFAVPSGNLTAVISQSGYTDLLLSSLGALDYQTYVQTAGSVAPMAELAVDTTGDNTPDDILIYRPADNGAVVRDTWQTWRTATATAWWRISGQTGTTTLAAYAAAHPAARIVNAGDGGGLRFVAGGEGATWDGFRGYIDNVVVSINGSLDSFDFD